MNNSHLCVLKPWLAAKKLLPLTVLLLTTVFVSLPLHANTYSECLPKLQEKALAKGVPPALVSDVLGRAKPLQRVIELDRSQPEFTSTFASYLSRRVTPTRVEKGRELYKKHRSLLQRITRETGVPGHYLVAFWGLETNYGGYKGEVSTIDALFTLACDPRRSRYFSQQLIAALQLMEQENLDRERMRGSWAGALGHVQFMPSNYLQFARDGDGDGERDLWNSVEDALYSAAWFLKSIGWQKGERWGREVVLPKDFSYQLAGLKNSKSLSAWRQLGIRDVHGNRLPVLDMRAGLIIPSGHEGPAFMAYQNFKVIMGWNRSVFYAISVGHLADRIAGAGALKNPPPQDGLRLSRTTIKQVQARLSQKGFELGKPDGIFGPASRRALRQFQQAEGAIADGYIDAEVLNMLNLSSKSRRG